MGAVLIIRKTVNKVVMAGPMQVIVKGNTQNIWIHIAKSHAAKNKDANPEALQVEVVGLQGHHAQAVPMQTTMLQVVKVGLNKVFVHKNTCNICNKIARNHAAKKKDAQQEDLQVEGLLVKVKLIELLIVMKLILNFALI